MLNKEKSIEKSIERSILTDLENEMKISILTPDFLEILCGETGIEEERANEIWDIVMNAGIVTSGKTVLGKSVVKAIFEMGLDEEELRYIHGTEEGIGEQLKLSKDRQFDILSDVERVFAGYLISQIELFEIWNRQSELSNNKSINKPTIRESKLQGHSVYLRLTDFVRPDTFYSISKLNNTTVLLKEIEMKIK